MLRLDASVQAWIGENLDRGCTLDAMVDAMVASGHPRAFAEAAIAQIAAGGASSSAPSPAPRASAPEPIPAGSPAFIETNDRRIAVLATLRSPRVIVFGGVLSEAECDELVEMSRTKVARSLVVNPITGEGKPHAERTSEGTFFYVNENPLVERLDRRIAELMRWPVENGEGLQILHYLKGGEYRPHYDYFDPNEPGSAAHIAKGGNRVGTLVIYLATSEEGGGTAFPDIGLEVAPIKGNAVFFAYDVATPASRTLHAGTPVERGEKWIATKWVRSGPYR